MRNRTLNLGDDFTLVDDFDPDAIGSDRLDYASDHATIFATLPDGSREPLKVTGVWLDLTEARLVMGFEDGDATLYVAASAESLFRAMGQAEGH